MPKSRKKKSPKRILALPDLAQAKAAVLNSLSSLSGQRTYDHAIDEFVRWYCSEPRAKERFKISHNTVYRCLTQRRKVDAISVDR